MPMPDPIEKLDRNFAPIADDAQRQWYDVRDLGLEGRGFADAAHDFDRLPARAKADVPEAVWQLSRHSAGMAVRFVTDATTIAARWSLRLPELAMNHMPATGVSGLDLYVRSQASKWRWLAVGRPLTQADNEVVLTAEMSPGTRQFMLYLPLYNATESLAIGLPKGATLQAAPAWTKPLCFYGTSIVHGGCASRPGMAYPAIVGRTLDRPHYNFGFSGNGQSQIEIAKLLAELDPAVYVIDPLPNMTESMVAERIEPFVDTLRAAHRDTPIVLVESIRYQQADFVPARRTERDAKNVALRAAFDRLIARGVNNLHLIPGDPLLGDDDEATVDGTHPTDLGFLRMADVIAPILQPLI